MSEHCRVCDEPMSDRYCAEQAHYFHEDDCPNDGLHRAWVEDCDCTGYVHPHCCGCELEHDNPDGVCPAGQALLAEHPEAVEHLRPSLEAWHAFSFGESPQ